MKRGITCVLALAFTSGCSSKSPVQTQQLTPTFVQVEKAESEMCRDDTLSPTEWFNVPVARFSASTVQLNGRAASEREFAIWADDYYRTKAERALWVQISPDGKPNAERVLTPIVRSYPDIQFRQVEFGFTCPKLERRR